MASTTSPLPSNYPLQVTVTPAQSSFFAGEELRCLITFTNLRQPVPQSQPLPSTSRFPADSWQQAGRAASHAFPSSQGHGHGRSQTIDLRKPPPGKPAKGAGSREYGDDDDHDDDDSLDGPVDGNALPSRKRIIGRNATPMKPSRNASGSASTTKHAKSASMAFLGKGPPLLSPTSPVRPQYDRAESLSRPSSSSRGASVSFDDSFTSSSPAASRPGSRKPSSTIHAAHPHSRKKSVIQVQNEDLSAAFELHGASNGNGGNGHTLYAQSANPSEVIEASGFYNLGRNDTMDSVVRDQLTHWSRGAAQPRLSISGPSSSPLAPNGSSSSSATNSPLFPHQKARLAPGTEVVYWSFAQFSGSYEIDESMIKPAEFEDVKRRLAYGGGIASPNPSGTPRLMGGGDLGYADGSGAAFESASTGWGAYLRSALGSGLSIPAGRHRRTGSTMLDSSNKTMTSKTIPLFSSPPSILSVDLHLPPGASKTYSFTLRLPADLPPSYYGKSVKFTYELVVGTNRLDAGEGAVHVGNQRSRLIKIPLRIYNYVGVEGARPWFDLTNPIVVLRDEAVVREEADGAAGGAGKDEKPLPSALVAPDGQDASVGRKKMRERQRGKKALKAYAASLLASYDEDFFASQRLRRGSGTSAAPGGGLLGAGSVADDGSGQSCKAAIEIISRNSQKVSYDISKDGSIAAVLTLIKSKYRLGDTILGVVSINRPTAATATASTPRVVRIAALLESYEEVEPTLATLPSARSMRMTRKVHAEHHESTLGLGQTSFQLPIPSGASPDFETSGVKLHWTVRISFLTSITTSPSPSTPSSDTVRPPPSTSYLIPCPPDGYSLYHTSYRAAPSLCGPSDNADGKETRLEIVECAVPVSVLPNSTRFKARPVSFAA
ncbi:Rgp1-domain-containing protein [Jaminaea rosea]|uniref:Rgp1-domain-containing protein n=1 Tax=Jaminaea rosea TaxID=1569628 RepID=A0A316UTH7_9BASI|nr:Rgp1-domain-containing protein [Jaminaea rosea]PWN28589.1 Rgp1-domain-containing protein [Jaminaea rosea]